ncbi:MAG: hypothetical protein E7557_04295, partial [Ruminococcaceae bacterium]|nr:hypothetical protein [Oscillospiraceae bacterium]
MKKTLKRTLCGVFVLLFMLANSNVAFAGNIIKFSTDLESPVLYNSVEVQTNILEKYVGDIDDFQAYILEFIKTDVPQKDTSIIDLSKYNLPYNEEVLTALYNTIWYESPELFRINQTGVQHNLITINSLIVNYHYYNVNDFNNAYNLMVETADKLLQGIKNNNTLSDVEKALLIHDRLAEYCEYDYENYLAGSIPDTSYNAYGALGLATAVCMGYALAYDYLLEQVGIEAEYCSSDALNHAWNIVYINGVPYHVDVTHDDPVFDMSGRVNHYNFLRSTEGIKSTGSHSATDFITTPTDTTYDNYFWQNSETAFQLVNDKIYYIDNVNGELNVIDDITDTTPETIVNLDYEWTTADGGAYWPGNYSRLASIRDKIFYSAPEAVYSYNPTTDVTEAILTQEYIKETTGSDGYRIYGMTAVGCILWGEFSETPNYTITTKREQIFAKGFHNPTENWKVVIEPTYTSEGKEKNYCIDCGAEVGSRLIPPLEDNHIWTDWYIDEHNPPSCTDKGVELRDCTHCDIFEWRYGTALGHDYATSWTVDLEPTCVRDGEESRHCTRCDNRIDIQSIDATGVHIEGDAWIKGKEATCKEDGYIYKACKGCTKEMSRQILPKGACTSFSTAGYKAVTCTENGYSGDKTCLDCGTVYKGETILAKGHKEVTVTGKAATCTATGLTEGKKCSVCGKVTVAQQTTAKTAHKISIVGAKKATTKEPGYTGDKICSVCNTVTEKGMEIPKLLTLATPTAKTANTAKGITITWNAVENAEKYIVYQRVYNKTTKKYSNWKAIKTTTGLSYTDTTVKLGTIYSHTVKAVNGSVASKYTPTKGLTYNVTPTVSVANASNG